MENTPLKWEAEEYTYREKTPDWFYALGIIAVSIAGTSIIFKNYLFGILILVATFSLMLFAKRKPSLVSFELNDRGLRINRLLYPYSTLESFWITNHEHGSQKLLVQSKKMLSPLLIIPLGETINQEEIRSHLLNFLKEKEQNEPIAEKIMERLGF